MENSTNQQKKTKSCPHCRETVDVNASKCPHCHEYIKNWFQRNPGTGLVLIIIFVILIATLISEMSKSGGVNALNSALDSALGN